MRANYPLAVPIIALAAAATSACTGQIPGSFRLQQQEQTFSSQQEINTKIDLLLVVDNSASMDVSQGKLRSGFSAFANKYMKPTWDIRMAVITTDTYMAHPSFTTYLDGVVPGTLNWQSPYVNARRASWVNPSWNPTLLDTTTGRFTNGVKFKEVVPAWGPNFAKLLAGNHDGPIVALCSEILPYFISGLSDCETRDLPGANTGPERCISPGGGESGITQCVNTIQNDTVRSGKPIISTMPPAGTPGDTAWTNQLIRDFTVNVTTGSAGMGSERGLGSIQQLLTDNEAGPNPFFRAGSLRGIIIVSDEEDQTMTYPTVVPAGFRPQSWYACDQAGVTALNPGNTTYCCSGGGCTYGSEGTTCPSKTIDGYTYTASLCPRADKLVPVADVKAQIDAFFTALDGQTAPTGTAPEGTGNYFVASIVPMTAQSIQDLQAARITEDMSVGAIKLHAVDRGDRYLELGNLVGNGSLSLDLAANDYTPVLDAIGRAIITKKSTFTLARAPTGQEDMLVKVLHADGSETVVPTSKYVVSGKDLTITDEDFILSLASTDRMVISYQPRSLN